MRHSAADQWWDLKLYALFTVVYKIIENKNFTKFFQNKFYLYVINASQKDDNDIQRQVKSLYCAANKLRGTFCSVLNCSENSLFRAYFMPMYACRLWSKHTQTNIKRSRVAHNNAYRIMHYIPRNASVRPHQVNHYAGVKRGGQGGHNSPGAKSLWGAGKSQQCRKQVLSSIQDTCFRKISGSNMGRQICFSPRAPSNLGAPLPLCENL